MGVVWGHTSLLHEHAPKYPHPGLAQEDGAAKPTLTALQKIRGSQQARGLLAKVFPRGKPVAALWGGDGEKKGELLL